MHGAKRCSSAEVNGTPKAPETSDARKVSRADVLRLVGLTLCSEHTARKALTVGPDKIRGIVGERVAEAMRSLELRPLSDQEQGK